MFFISMALFIKTIIPCSLVLNLPILSHYETVSCEFLTYFICHLIISHLIFYHQFCLLILILSIFIINLDYSYSSSLIDAIHIPHHHHNGFCLFHRNIKISVMMNFMFYENDNKVRNCRYISVMNFM